uniref:DBF4-type domain-containing protein n=1 Tax=Latimeria chalumnae TaxID=7897 RepID=H2ZWS4_LATCH
GTSSMQSRQGYCSCCQVLYSNLEQHVQCSQHRQRAGSSRNRIVANSLMERFLQDVMHHHPVRYDDSRAPSKEEKAAPAQRKPSAKQINRILFIIFKKHLFVNCDCQVNGSCDSDHSPPFPTPTPRFIMTFDQIKWLKEAHIMLEDEKYETQLDSVLKVSQEKDEIEFKSEKNNIVEEKVPPSPYVPPTFVGKTWSQIMYEDDLKIEALVREFREGHFRSYFDSDSLANFGRRSSKKLKDKAKIGDDPSNESSPKEAAAEALPSYESRTWCLASRCQYYDPLTNRILKMPPKGLIEGKSKKKLPCVRQLFRSLSPDIN